MQDICKPHYECYIQNKMKKIYILIFLTILSSCSTQKVVFNTDKDAEVLPAYKKDELFFLNGIGQTSTTDIRKICDSAEKVHSVQAKTTFLNGFLGIITNGLYTPREGSVFCVDND